MSEERPIQAEDFGVRFKPYPAMIRAEGGGLNLGAGGEASGEFGFSGPMVWVRGLIRLGGEGFAAGHGRWLIALPVPAKVFEEMPGHRLVGSGLFLGSERPDLAPAVSFMCIRVGTEEFEMTYVERLPGLPYGPGRQLGSESDWAFTNGDQVSFELTYFTDPLTDPRSGSACSSLGEA